MNEKLSAAEPFDARQPEPEGTMLALFVAMAGRKKFILTFTFAVAIVTAGLSLMMPNVYRASARLLPPQQAQSSAMGLLSQLGGAAGMAGGLAGIKNPNEMYVGMLKSRTVADQLLDQHQLMKVYDTTSREKARLRLASDSAISTGKDGLITIAFDSADPKLAADVANSYVGLLIKLTGVLAVTEAGQRRLFYEKQLEEAKDKLALAEVTLKKSLDSSGVISVDADSRAILETVARVRAQVSAKEVQLGSMQAFVTNSNPEYRRVEQELASLRSELLRLENGRPGGAATAPDRTVGLGNIKILRDVKYYQMLYELLAKQYEVARLDEARDASVIQVLDSAVAPEQKVAPARALMVLLASLLAFLLACIVAALLAVTANMQKNPEMAAQLAQLKANLRIR